MAPTAEELRTLSQTDVRSPIPPSSLLPALTSAPFIPTQSMVNLRDTGLVPGSRIRPGLAYRSGTLVRAADDPDARAWLASHVRRVFDVRRDTERALAPDPDVPGVELVWLPSEGEDTRPDLESFVEGGGEKGVEGEYLKTMEVYRPTFKAVLEHVRDRPGEPFLFHCSAGRDRTGVLGGLLQSLAGTDPETVRLDYMLSRLGTEPAREMLLQYARLGVGVTDDSTPGFLNLCSLRESAWDYFVEQGVKRTYGGWEGYVTGPLGFSNQDLATIKRNLTEPTP